MPVARVQRGLISTQMTSSTLGTQKAVKALKSRKLALATWAAVSVSLGGINRGTLVAVAKGKRKPTLQLLKALEIVKPPTSEQAEYNRIVARFRRIGRHAAKHGEGFIE